MATSSEQWDARRAKREEMRAKKKARQKKMLIILAAAVAVLLVVIALIVFLPSKKDEAPDAPPAADVQQSETPEEQPEETEASEEEDNPNIKTIRIAAAGDVNITDKVIAHLSGNSLQMPDNMDRKESPVRLMLIFSGQDVVIGPRIALKSVR